MRAKDPVIVDASVKTQERLCRQMPTKERAGWCPRKQTPKPI